MGYQKPKGTMDILPGEVEKWQYVESVARNVFKNMIYTKLEHQCLNT